MYKTKKRDFRLASSASFKISPFCPVLILMLWNTTFPGKKKLHAHWLIYLENKLESLLINHFCVVNKDQRNYEKVVIRLRRPMGQRAEERSQLKVEDYTKHLEVVPSAGISNGQPWSCQTLLSFKLFRSVCIYPFVNICMYFSKLSDVKNQLSFGPLVCILLFI